MYEGEDKGKDRLLKEMMTPPFPNWRKFVDKQIQHA
jgi:hypothetical protein